MSDETKQLEAEPKQETDLSARVDAIEGTLRQYGMDLEEDRPKQRSSRRSILKRQIDALMWILESEADAQTKLAVSREITVLRGLQPRRARSKKAAESLDLLGLKQS
jgi:hypothetical protein